MMSILPNDRERLAPISLPREKPVAQFVIDGALPETAFLQPRRDFANRLARRKPVNNRRVDRDSITDKSDRIFITGRLHNRANRQVEFAREFEIAFVMRGDGLDSAGAVA